MAEVQRIAPGGEGAPVSGLGLTAMPSDVYQHYLQQIRASLTLSPNCTFQVVTEYNPDVGTRVWVRGQTPDGAVSESIEISASTELEESLGDTLRENRAAIEDVLLDGLSKSLVAALAAPPAAEEAADDEDEDE